jgi:hypothetical protein
MHIRDRSWLGMLTALGACVIFGLAITSVQAAPFILIPLLVGTIVTMAMVTLGEFDLVVLLVTAAGFLLPMNNVRINSSLTIGDGLLVAALVVVCIERAMQRSVAIPGMIGLLAAIVMIVGGGLLGSFFASSLSASVTGLFKFGAATIILPVLFGLWRPDITKLRAVSWGIVLGSTVSDIAGILFIRTVGRAQGLSTHPNHLALASVMAVGIGLGLAYSTGARGRLILAGALPILMIGTLLSGSRSGLVAEVLVVAIIALLTHDRKLIVSALAATVVFGAAVGLGLVGHSGTSAIGRLLGGGGAGGSDQQRSLTINAALHTIVRHPVTGGGFELALSTHEIILEVAATAGIFGVVGLGLAGWLVLRPTWVRYRWGTQRSHASGDLLLIGAMAAVGGFYANGIFGNQLYDRYIWIVFALAAALAHELLLEDRQAQAQAQGRSQSRPAAHPATGNATGPVRRPITAAG